MSSYVREKVLRIPIKYTNLEAKYGDLESVFDNIANDFPELYEYATVGKFQLAPTEGYFLDYVLDYEYDADGEFGKIRDLYESEKQKYKPIFDQILGDCDMDKVRLVEFCWYNCCEAPDYYDKSDDPFFEEV